MFKWKWGKIKAQKWGNYQAHRQAGTTAYNPNGYLDVYYVISASGTVVASGQVLPGAFSSALQQAVAS